MATWRPFIGHLSAAAGPSARRGHTGTQTGSESCEAFLAYYGVVSSMAERSVDLTAELQPVIDFVAIGPREKAEVPPNR